MKSKLLAILFFAACQKPFNPYKEGQRIYLDICSPCHGANGEGLGTLYPNLNDSNYINSNRGQLSCWIKNGIKINLRYGFTEMPPNSNLSESDICNVLNYLNSSYWHSNPYHILDITKQLKECNSNK